MTPYPKVTYCKLKFGMLKYVMEDAKVKIMFICTGNICRSAMAEAILRKKVIENKYDIGVYSAGTYAENGDVPTCEAIEVMAERNIDIRGHSATNVKNSPIAEMDLILCATKTHKMQLINMYPEIKNRIFTIKEYAYGKEEDISDPWGRGENIYQICAEDLEKCIDKIVEKVIK